MASINKKVENIEVLKQTKPKGGAMRNTIISCALLATVAFAGFCDQCNVFNSSLWYKAEETWSDNLGWARAANDSASGGYYYLKLKKYTWDGAEIYTRQRYGYGCARALFKCPAVSGAISALEFYQGYNSGRDEIDIEVYKNGSSWRIDFVVWKGGNKIWKDSLKPPELKFDPSAGFHEYAIDYAVGGIAFFVDGQNKRTCRVSGRPSSSMMVLLNCWWPRWLSGKKPTSDQYMKIDWISYTNYQGSFREGDDDGSLSKAGEDSSVVLKTEEIKWHSFESSLQVSPTLFATKTSIQFEITGSLLQNLTLSIFDASGRIVKELVNHPMMPGLYNFKWDGKDANGKRMPSGIYFCRLTTEAGSVANKIILTR